MLPLRTVRLLKYYQVDVRLIPARVSSRSELPTHSLSRKRLPGLQQPRVLANVKRSSSRNASTVTHPPKVFLTNVGRIRNKMDEAALRLQQLSPDIRVAVFRATWLSDTIPDNAISVMTFRQDRDNNCRDLLVYISSRLKFHTINSCHVPSLQLCCTEILSYVYVIYHV